MPGARCTGGLACKIAKKRTRAYRFSGGNPTFPAQWFYGLLRALPGDQACLTPSSARLLADLTPASGRQNDTTWPYASRPRSSRALPASTASLPAFVTFAKRPSHLFCGELDCFACARIDGKVNARHSGAREVASQDGLSP